MKPSIVPDIAPGERVLNLGNEGGKSYASEPMVARATDPVISPAYAVPGDFAAQYPTPLDPTEIIAMCEEITLWQALPEEGTASRNTHGES